MFEYVSYVFVNYWIIPAVALGIGCSVGWAVAGRDLSALGGGND